MDLSTYGKCRDRDIDVIDGALLIAQGEYPDLDVASYRQQVEELAAGATRFLGSMDRSTPEALDRFNDFFFGMEGFGGNETDYYDPSNSYLNDVLDRRLGIPISLAVLHVELGRRAGLDLYGIAFPGRFLVGCRLPGQRALVDCFEGRLVSLPGCQALLDLLFEGSVLLEEKLLRPARRRTVLARMVHNLLAIFVHRRDLPRALRHASMAVELEPASARPFRDRGLLHYQMEAFAPAILDLQEYLRRKPDAPDAQVVRHHLETALARQSDRN